MNLKKKFVIGAASLALVAGMGVAPAMAGTITLPGGGKLDRLSGDTRVETSLKVAEERMKTADGFTAPTKVYLVNSAAYIDAATAGMLQDGIVVLVPSNAAEQKILGKTLETDFSTVTDAQIIGGTAAMPESVKDNLDALRTTGFTWGERLGGATRYDTNVAIAEQAFPSSAATGQAITVTRGDMIPDALGAGAIVAGPVILVPPSGDIPQATLDYVQTVEAKNNLGVSLILGGQASLSDSQVQKLFKETKTIDPWSYNKTYADLKADVQKAAVTYEGQKKWQERNGNTGDATADLKEYFGLHEAAATLASNGSYDPNDIKIDAAQSKPLKAFKGYAPILKELTDQQDLVDGKVETLKTALDTAVAGLKNTKPGAEASQTAVDAKYNTAAIKKAFEDLYGAGTFKPLKVKDVSASLLDVTDWGIYKKDDVSAVDGLKDVADMVAKHAGDNPSKPVTCSGKDLSLADAIFETDLTTSCTGAKIDWVAAKSLLDSKTTEYKKAVKEKLAALNAAVAAYKAGPQAEVLMTNPGGIPRLAGSDRYETSALLAYFLTHPTKGVPTPQLDKFNVFYIASGTDAYLVDSVVAGQLNKTNKAEGGPILLVPADGKLPEVTKSAIKTLAKDAAGAKTNAFVIGGPKAVTEASAKEAAEVYTAAAK